MRCREYMVAILTGRPRRTYGARAQRTVPLFELSQAPDMKRRKRVVM
jgi:hypothetical protein